MFSCDNVNFQKKEQNMSCHNKNTHPSYPSVISNLTPPEIFPFRVNNVWSWENSGRLASMFNVFLYHVDIIFYLWFQLPPALSNMIRFLVDEDVFQSFKRTAVEASMQPSAAITNGIDHDFQE